MQIGARTTTGWRATISVAMSNYIEAGSIIAIATSLAFWQSAFGISNFAVGLLAALSANAFGAAIGAILGGPLCDRFGRKAIYTYDLLVYMAGVLLAAFAMNFAMLLAAFVITGIAVGAGVPASWTYIAEAGTVRRPCQARRHGATRVVDRPADSGSHSLPRSRLLDCWGRGLIFLHLFVVAAVVWWVRQGSRSRRSGPRRAAKSLPGLPMRSVHAACAGSSPARSTSWLCSSSAESICSGTRSPARRASSCPGSTTLRVCTARSAEPPAGPGVGLHRRRHLLWLHALRRQDVSATALRHRAAFGIVGWIVLVGFTGGGVPTMLVFAVLWGISSGLGAQAFYSLWASEMFATPYRASAQGVMFFVVRSVTGLLSYFFPTLLAVTGLTGVGLLLIGLLTVALVIGAVWAPETRERRCGRSRSTAMAPRRARL